MAKKYQKHAYLERPNVGSFGRNEWAIIGAPCGDIKELATNLIQKLAPIFKVAYVDADHHSVAAPSSNTMSAAADMIYTDKITHHQFEIKEQLNEFQLRPLFKNQDLILLNGNHFTGKNQIVIIDPRKKASLEKKLDQLTNVQMILLTDDNTEVYDFLAKYMRGMMMPIYSILDIEMIAQFIQFKMKEDTPPVYGLVLAGGKSSRMGEDKGAISYHDKPQREYAADLLLPYCEQVFISCRKSQLDSLDTNHGLLPDTFLGLGPYGGILSAFQKYPNVAWMVIACDLPLLDKDTLDTLAQNRNTSKVATCFKSNRNEFPEPLITIWEPRSYATLLMFLSQGYSCPRKVLINSDVVVLPTPKGDKLKNINTPEERKELER